MPTCRLAPLGLIAFAVASGAVTAPAQEREPAWACAYTTLIRVPDEVPFGFTSDPEVEGAIRRIVRAMGLAPRFDVESARIENAAATMRSGRRLILYDPSFFGRVRERTGTDWAATSILAHEVGHHLNAHVFGHGPSAHERELEADRFSGFVLQRLGASEQQALVAMRLIGSEHPSATHPERPRRLSAISAGWREAAGGQPGRDGRSELPRDPEPRAPRRAPTWPDDLEDEPLDVDRVTDTCTLLGTTWQVSERGSRGARRQRPLDPSSCLFDVVTPRGRACIDRTGRALRQRGHCWEVIGQCRPSGAMRRAGW